MIAARRRQGEDGLSIAMAVLAMTIVAMIMLFVGTQALNSIFTARKKSDRSVGMAAGDSGVEKVRAALQQRLADESNNFQLDAATLTALVKGQVDASGKQTATVLPNSQTSDKAGMSKVRVPGNYAYTVREEGSDTIGWWQVYDVIPPRYYDTAAGGPGATNLVIYIRAWATTKGTSGQITTKPRIFRVEYRPGFFSDYQAVSDGPFFAKDNAPYIFNGPIHSNGYETMAFMAMDGGVSRKGVFVKSPSNCTKQARFSTSQNTPISVAGGSCAAAVKAGRRNARQLSLLGVKDAVDYMGRRCNQGLVVCRTGAGSYNIRLGYSAVSVNGQTFNLRPDPGNESASLAVLVDGNVTLSGSLTMPGNRAGRVTIATHHTGNTARTNIFLRNNNDVVGAAVANKDTVGIIAEGDIVLGSPPAAGCARAFNMAAISMSGSITLAPEFVTLAPPAVNLNNKACSGTVPFHGSLAGHGQFAPSISWLNPATGSRTPYVGYTRPRFDYNPNLFTNPPPFFPTATPWAVVTAKDADNRCLVAPNAGDPRCE